MRRTPRWTAGFGFAWLVLPACTAVFAADEPARSVARKPELPVLEVEKYNLPNGLTVLLHQDHKTPMVAVNVLYKVGSKDEKAGRTGFAHLFEHMMFQGSQNHDRDYFLPLEKLGADLNGSTAEDQTVYYETVPSNALELALWLEADRMGFLLPAMTQGKLDNQRDVVKNERRQTVDNVPYGQAEERLLEALYPATHPYHHSVIGSIVDLSAGRLADVAAFFRTYYAPNNAILCIAGDFRPDQARKWVEKYFGTLARGPRVESPSANVPVLAAAKHIEMTDAVSLPRAELIWPTVPANHPDEAALDVLAAVLGGLPKENRLFRALVYDRQLAAQVDASHPTRNLSGTFEVEFYARPGQKLDKLVQIADAELDRLKNEGPTAAEVRKAQNERESALIMGLQSVTRKASVLNQYMSTLGDPLGYRTELDKVFAVTPGDVARVAKKYLGPARIELLVLPGPPASRPPEVTVQPAQEAARADRPPDAVPDDFDRSKMPDLGPLPPFAPPTFTRRKLSNGLELLIVERHDLPIVTFDLIVKSGETLTPKGKEGLGSIAASLLDEGTTTRTTLQMAGELAEIGASLGTSGGHESTSVSLTTLKRHLEPALDLFADVILNPSFPEKELDRLKLERLAQLQAQTDDAEQTAAYVFPRLIFGLEHPYGRPDLGTPGSIRSITRENAVAFCRQIMVPANAALVVVGDVRPDGITTVLEGRLRAWASGPIPAQLRVSPPPSVAPTNRTIRLVDKPAAAQSVLTIGRTGTSRKSPDYFALTILNSILGGQFSSRINMNLREDKGYSYGAQSSFSFLRGGGSFVASATVQTAVTKESMVELVKELTDITRQRPVTDEEISFAKERIIQGFPHRFETTFGVAGQLGVLVEDELPDDEFVHYQARIEAVTKADVARVAHEYITPEKMAILVVGDRSVIEKPLKSLPFVDKIERLDTEGDPVPEDARAKPAAAVEPAAPGATKKAG
jgi:zinc protease